MEVFRNVFLSVTSDFTNVANHGVRAITYPMVWFRYASKSDPCCLDKLFSDRSFFSDTLRKVSKEQIIFLKTMGADTGKIYRIYKIPAGLSGFFSGLKVAATYCVSGAVVGEWLSAQAGLGYYMIRVKNSYQIDKVFAAIICVILLSLLLNGACSLLKKGIIVCFIFFKRRGSNEKLWLLLPLLLLLSACGTAKETSSKQEIKDLKK